MSRNGKHTSSVHTLLSVLIIHTYSRLGMAPPPIFCNNNEEINRRLNFPGGWDVVCSPRVLRVQYDQEELHRLIWFSLGTRKYFGTDLCLQQKMQYHDNNNLSESWSLVVVVVFFTFTDRASTIPSNTRGCQSGTWSAGQKKIRGTSTKLQ